jgi:ABC-type dipeptide/oligopeptide/nickel transport system permease component
MMGRDVLSRIIYGSRISLTIGFIAVGIATALGILIGVAAGYYGGWIDNVLMRITDILFAFPSLLLAIVIVAVIGQGLDKAMIAIGIGLYLGIMRGFLVILLLVFGFFCAFFYTAPPIRFGYRGLGEIAQLLCFGPAIGLGAYYVQAQRISWEAFWGTLPFGIMLFSMITINEILTAVNNALNGCSGG